MVGQLKAARQRIEDGKAAPTFAAPQCFCSFFRRYFLPCKHLFHHQLAHGWEYSDGDEESGTETEGADPKGILTAAAWNGFAQLFEEGAGYDVWSVNQRVEVPVVDVPVDRGAKQRKDEVRECLGILLDYYFRLEEGALSQQVAATQDGPSQKKRKGPSAPNLASTQEYVAALQTFTGQWTFHICAVLYVYRGDPKLFNVSPSQAN